MLLKRAARIVATVLSYERKPRVLMAVGARAAERISRILGGEEPARPASLSELVYALRCCRFDLIIVGCHFDGSRAIEAMQSARLLAPQVPLACVYGAPFSSPLGEATLAAFHAAAEALGVDCFVDLLKFPDDADGNARVRAMFERLVFVT